MSAISSCFFSSWLPASLYSTSEVPKSELSGITDDQKICLARHGVELLAPDVSKSLVALNREFIEKGRITGAVGLLYYPSEITAGIEIEGRCYFTKDSLGEHNSSYDRKLVARQKGIHCDTPIVRVGISMTPKELRSIKPSSFGITCMEGAIATIRSVGKNVVPFPLSLSPVLSTGYLLGAKILGSRNVTMIHVECGDRRENGFKALAWAAALIGIELGLIVSGVYQVYQFTLPS